MDFSLSLNRVSPKGRRKKRKKTIILSWSELYITVTRLDKTDENRHAGMTRLTQKAALCFQSNEAGCNNLHLRSSAQNLKVRKTRS